jgi:hypothetical protein
MAKARPSRCSPLEAMGEMAMLEVVSLRLPSSVVGLAIRDYI